nr:MAG TPA: hypothetical protein [Caudoviricetes sp.]
MEGYRTRGRYEERIGRTGRLGGMRAMGRRGGGWLGGMATEGRTDGTDRGMGCRRMGWI